MDGVRSKDVIAHVDTQPSLHHCSSRSSSTVDRLVMALPHLASFTSMHDVQNAYGQHYSVLHCVPQLCIRENHEHFLQLSCGAVCVIIRLAILVEHRLVTYGQTGGRRQHTALA